MGPLLLVLFIVLVPLNPSSEPDDPTGLAASLEVTTSEMRHSTSGDGNRFVTILGELRNNGESALKHPHFSVRFHDASGELIDAHSHSEHSLILAPGSERAFTVRGIALEPASAYVGYEIEVTGAARARVY